MWDPDAEDNEKIVAERDRIVDRMVAYFLAREGAKALFLSGSLAAGTADTWSDIDFRVVVEPERYERFLEERSTAPAGWGDLLFNQVPPGSTHSVSHFRPFIKVDTFYYSPIHLQASPWYTLPIRVLFDPERLVECVIEKSRGLAFVPTAQEVDESVTHGLAAAHEVFRRLSRGEPAYAGRILDELRQAMIDAEDYLQQRPAYGFSHLETRADETFVATLYQSYCPLEREPIQRSLAGLAEVYRLQVLNLHRTFRLARNLEHDLDSIDIVLRGPERAPPSWSREPHGEAR